MMKKHFFVLIAAISSFAFFSCSNLKEESSSVSFSLSQNSARAITSEASGDWSLKISLSGGINKEESFDIQTSSAADAQSFTVGNLSSGETVTVDVGIYCGEIRYYKAKETKSLTLESGENNVDIVLVRDTANGTIGIIGADELITAVDSDGTTYKTGAEIPYTSGTLTFSLSGLDEENTTYAWYLNGNDLETTTSTLSFNPYEESKINIDDSNTVSCKVTISGETYVAEMSFTFTGTSRSAAVWFDGINQSDSYYSLKQLSYSDSTSTTTASASTLVSDFSTDASTTPLYCFDSSCNLWTAVLGDSGLTLTKYTKQVSTEMYSTSGTSYTVSDITSAPADICYEPYRGLIYILVADTSDTESTVYAVDISEPSSLKSSLTLSNSITENDATATLAPSQIAVYGNTVYIAANVSLYSSTYYGYIFKITFEDNGTSVTSYTPEYLTTLCTSTVLDGYDSTNETEIEISDLQVGDGLGSETDNLYVLLRDYYIYSDGGTSNFACYSRGALVAIDTSDSTATPYGWSSTTSTIYATSTVSGTLYTPTSTTITDTNGGFYGPTRFVAVVPKKLVILDDGVVYSTVGKVKNQDSLVEFDIEGKSLSRGASVSATAVIASGFTVSE